MKKELQKWADQAMYRAEPMDTTRPRAYLLSATPDPLGAIAAACMMYEGKVCRDIERDVNHEMREHYWEQVKRTHLKAPLEFVDLHFMIEGVTRAFTHQMVRQRTAVYAQESLRFAVKENLRDEVAKPPSIPFDPENNSLEEGIWDGAIEAVESAYHALIDMGVPAEDARGLLPHAVTTRLNYKTNLRNLVDHAGNRLCTQAQFEWRWAIASMVGAIRDHGPGSANWQWKRIADDELFRPVCFQMGHCPFNADFDRGCTIRPRVEEGRFDEIKPAEWLADPTAARVR
jgi:flavin-dependent thymidylate synthase